MFYKVLKILKIVHVLVSLQSESSIVNEVIKTISIFVRRDFNQKKRKINNFPPLRSFCAQKIVAFVVQCLLIFVLLVDFCWIYVFVRLKSFRKNKQNKINRLEIILITSFTILLKCTPINCPIENLFVCTYFYLCESLIICKSILLL